MEILIKGEAKKEHPLIKVQDARSCKVIYTLQWLGVDTLQTCVDA